MKIRVIFLIIYTDYTDFYHILMYNYFGFRTDITYSISYSTYFSRAQIQIRMMSDTYWCIPYSAIFAFLIFGLSDGQILSDPFSSLGRSWRSWPTHWSDSQHNHAVAAAEFGGAQSGHQNKRRRGGGFGRCWWPADAVFWAVNGAEGGGEVLGGRQHEHWMASNKNFVWKNSRNFLGHKKKLGKIMGIS